MSELQLDPDLLATLQTLETHRVEFVLVGDIADAIYNHGGFVSGVAIVPGAYGRNVERLRNALLTMNAELGIGDRPDPRDLDWRRIDLREITPCSFMTAYADIDIDFEPAGTSGYRDLFQDAERYEIAPGARPYVVSPDDLDRVLRRTGPRPDAPDLAYPVAPPAPAPRPAAIYPPEPAMAAPPAPPSDAEVRAEDDYDPGIWTEEEFRAIRAGRITF
jgi:hypothetical protein